LVVASLDAGAFPPAGTLSFWYRAGAQATGAGNLFDSVGASKLRLVDAVQAPTESMEAHFYGESGQIAQLATAPFASGGWVHVVVVWDSTHGALYTGSPGASLVAQTTSLATPFTPSNEAFALGVGVVGTLDEVRLYNRVLDDSEVRRIP
jgi:hypothetical protein